MWIMSIMLLSVILIGIFPSTFGKFIICVVMPLMGFVIGCLLTYIVGIGPALLSFSEYSKTGDTGTLGAGVFFSLLSLILPVGMICYAFIFHAVYSKASDIFDNFFEN